MPDLAGSLGGGGRYDGLIGMFCGEDIPACGFSLGLERILVVMGERGMFPPGVQQAPADVLVTLFDGEPIAGGAAAGRRAARRRAARRGLSGAGQARQAVQVRGRARHPRSSTVVGGDERASGQVTIKDLQTGEQTVGRARGRGSRRAASGQLHRPHEPRSLEAANRRTLEPEL